MLFAMLLTLLVASVPLALPQEDRRAQVTAKYHELFLTDDAAGLQKLWSEHEGLVLQILDADLEGSLALWEAQPEDPPKAEIEALQKRALFAASCASEAFRRPIFLDYASSFVGWSDEQKHDFRAGQEVYGRAAQELSDNNAEMALAAAKETVLRAVPLGDWWGTAMGYAAQGRALQELGELQDALSAYSQARLLNADLGLQFAEYQSIQGMLTCARALECWQRARVLAAAVVEYAKGFGDEQGLKAGQAAQKQIEKELARQG